MGGRGSWGSHQEQGGDMMAIYHMGAGSRGDTHRKMMIHLQGPTRQLSRPGNLFNNSLLYVSILVTELYKERAQ